MRPKDLTNMKAPSLLKRDGRESLQQLYRDRHTGRHTHKYIHTYIDTDSQAYRHTSMHKYIHTGRQADIQRDSLTGINTQMQSHTIIGHTCIHANIQAYTVAGSHTK